MKHVVDFKESYKDEIARFASVGVVVAKHPSFNISNEIGFFVGTNKILKSNYKFYLSLDANKVPNGTVCLSKEGKVLLFATSKDGVDDAMAKLLNKCDELLEAKKYPQICARVDVNYILKFNDKGYKTLRFLENDNSQFKFVVEKK